MSWTIKWTKQGRDDYANILSFTENNYGTDAAVKLLDKVEKT
jgi:plasmid stabilization system protein ParE